MNTSEPNPTLFQHGINLCKRVLARNPLYPLSAALLLLSINELSTDPSFLPIEELKLLFNFGALQFYELLAVATAILLVRRQVRYDALLLVALDSILILVPFILITQASLIGQGFALLLSALACLLISARLSAVKRLFTHSPLPASALAIGGVFLIANAVLPFLYRQMMEKDVADWAEPSRIAWCLGLPLLQCTALFLLPRTTHQPRWFAPLLLHLWIAGTAVHIRCIDYISSFNFEFVLLAPVLWCAGWTTALNASKWFMPRTAQFCRLIWPALPTLPLLLLLPDNALFVLSPIAGANAILLTFAWWRTRHPAAGPLAWTSLVFGVVGFRPSFDLSPSLPSGDSHIILTALTLAVAGAAMMNRKWIYALIGAAAAQFIPVLLNFAQPIPTGFQLALAYLLLHGLLWPQYSRPVAILQRCLAVLVVIQGWAWIFYGKTPASVVLVSEGVTLTLFCLGYRVRRGHWPALRLLMPGPLLMSGPFCPTLYEALRSSPKGVLILLVSFLIFGLGTCLAFTKKVWHDETKANPSS